MTPNENAEDSFALLIQDIRELRRDMMAGFFVVVAAVIGSNAFF